MEMRNITVPSKLSYYTDVHFSKHACQSCDEFPAGNTNAPT